MSVIDKFKDLVGIEEEYDEDDFDAEEEEYGYDRKTVETRAPLTSQSRYGGSDNVVSMQNRTVKAITSTFKLMVIEPKGFDECSKLVDSLKSRKPIIVNLEKLDADTARKIFDVCAQRKRSEGSKQYLRFRSGECFDIRRGREQAVQLYR